MLSIFGTVGLMETNQIKFPAEMSYNYEKAKQN